MLEENLRYMLADDVGDLRLFVLDEKPRGITLDLEAKTWQRHDGRGGNIGSTILTDASDENALVPGTIVFVLDCTDSAHLENLIKLQASVDLHKLHLVG